MKKNDKKKLTNGKAIILVVLVVTIILITMIYIMKEKYEIIENPTINQNTEEFVEVLDDQTRLNTSEKLQETKKYEGLEISKLKIIAKYNVTLLTGIVTNVSEEKQGGYPINITIQNKEGNEIITISAFVEELEPGNTSCLSVSSTFDYANAYDLIITKRR